MLRDLEKRNSCGPNIRGDGVRLACDTFRCHIITGANESVGLALSTEVARDTEIAELDSSISAKQNVRWLDVTMNDSPGMQISHLQGKNSVTTLELASCYSATSTFTKAIYFDNSFLQAGNSPSLFVQFVDIEGPSLLKAQLVKGLESLQASISLHRYAAFASFRRSEATRPGVSSATLTTAAG
ncbi:hypothetical protein HG530_003315 [Fusarium avenaceum]|nr:hypothetical protein HG530_003315 [Fusarium avenaceum]